MAAGCRSDKRTGDMSAIRHKAKDYREYGPYDRFTSKRVGRLFMGPRYLGGGRRSRCVPLLAYQTRAFRDCVFI